MKGSIFIALEEFIVAEQGLGAWHKILDGANQDGVYTATANYVDQQLMDLVEQICVQLSISSAEALRLFGTFLFTFLHKGHPLFAESQPSFYNFIASIDNVIHIEVHKLDEHAKPPHIGVKLNPDKTIDVHYQSQRKLCFLAEGLLFGAAEYYGNKISIEHIVCMHDSQDHCLLRITVDE